MFSRSRKSNSPGGSPLDRRQQALREAEENLRKQQAQLERLLDEAPRLREETARRQREELSHTPIMDRHAYHASTRANPAFGRRKLRREKQDGVWLFLALVAVLASVVFWIWSLLP